MKQNLDFEITLCHTPATGAMGEGVRVKFLESVLQVKDFGAVDGVVRYNATNICNRRVIHAKL